VCSQGLEGPREIGVREGGFELLSVALHCGTSAGIERLSSVKAAPSRPCHHPLARQAHRPTPPPIPRRREHHRPTVRRCPHSAGRNQGEEAAGTITHSTDGDGLDAELLSFLTSAARESGQCSLASSASC
jgi:hypothetical protein